MLGFLGTDHPVSTFYLEIKDQLSSCQKLNMLAMGAAAGFLGAATGGFFKAGPMISKQYRFVDSSFFIVFELMFISSKHGYFSHVVTGAFSLMLTLMMLLIPIIVNAVLDGEMGIERWQRVFLGTAALMVS